MGDTISNNTVQLKVKDGVATIEQGTALTRLHYFDGKFLRADALTLEQDYHRMLVRLSNLAGGWGVVHGLGVGLSGNMLSLTPGLAITPAGSTVLLSSAINVEIAKLLAAAAPAPANPPTPGVVGNGSFGSCGCSGPESIGTTLNTGYYEITVGPVEGLCGNEEVYGKLCEDACVTDSQSPYWKEGLILRLRPISLNLLTSTAVPPAAIHLRNRVASAYFASEPWLTASLLSAAGLNSTTWCNPATLYTRDEVPIGLLVQNGTVTQFIDAWSARRERMDTQAKGYWQGRMMMRPWNVFIAQILQFQCQLAGSLSGGTVAPEDECQDIRDLLASSLRELELVQLKYAQSSDKILQMLGENSESENIAKALKSPYNKLAKLSQQLSQANLGYTALPANRLLINSGFMELPPAGYLPVDPASQPVNEQLKRMFGEGVKLYFCTARPDYIPHAVEEAQHMDRISLTRGLDNPAQIEEVEIFVPNGQIIDALSADTGTHWTVSLSSQLMSLLIAIVAVRATPSEPEPSLENPAVGTATPADTQPGGPFGAMMMSRRLGDGMREYAVDGASRGDAFDQSGIARTTQLEGGGAALTLVSSPTPSLVAGPASRKTKISAQYLDLRITQDPFARQEGDQVPAEMELRLVLQMTDDNGNPLTLGETIVGAGKFTVQALYAVDNQTMAVDGELDILLGLDIFPDLPEFQDAVDKLEDKRVRLPVTVQRQGDSRSGRTLILPANLLSNRGGFGWLAAWQGQPRNAVFGLYASQPDGGLYTTMSHSSDSATLNRLNTGSSNNFAGNPYANAPVMIEAPTAENFKAYLEMDELTVPLQPENPLRLQALNNLSAIATATDDAAFLARARRLLFPDSVAPMGEVLVRATQDWVMFRRRRKAQCDLSCHCAPQTTVEAFQTWHVQLEGDDQIEQIIEAIDENDLEVAKRFDFKRVDVLHYADAAQSPTETLTQVLNDWQAVNPGANVVLGRVWETTPQTGQGWQNHARLKRLTEMLSSLINPPGTGQLKSLPQPPQALADQQFDGGMLLVTLGTTQKLHRVYIVSEAHADVQRSLINSPDPGIHAHLEKYADYKVSLAVNNNDGFTAADIAALKQKYDAFNAVQSYALELISKAAGADTAPIDKRHKNVLNGIGVAVNVNGSVFSVNEPHFGTGVAGATVIYYAAIN